MEQLEQDELEELLSSFSCSFDHDIEMFLRDEAKAISFEKLQKSCTYLIVDEEQLLDNNLTIADLTIYGYYSVALKVLSIPDDYSNNKRKQLDGLSAKIHGEVITDIPCYLIGQLARNSEISNELLSGNEILNMAYSVILNAVEAVGGRVIMIECRDNEKLIDFYMTNGFEVISELPDNEIPMKQMIRRIC